MTDDAPAPSGEQLSPSEVQAQIHYRLVERLSARERHYRGLVEGLRDPVFQCDPSGVLTFVNAAWGRMFEEDESASRGRNLLDYAHPEDIGIVRRALATVTEGPDEKALTGEFLARRGDGSTVHVEFSLRRSPDAGLVGALHNVSAQKEVQDSLRAAKNFAEEANRMKGAFLANMSHEIRTPLSAVMGFAEFLGDDDLTPAERREYVARVRRNGQQLLALVNDILDFSKIENGHLEVTEEAFAPCQLVDDVVEGLTEEARARGVALAVRWEGDPPAEPLLVSDPIRLRQILSNLLTNALKFTSDGSVELVVSVDAKAERIRYSVVDSGIGIPTEMIRTIFEPFQQADSTSTRKHGGTGLGLAISQRLAGLLGGEIEVDSRVGDGSRFTLALPLRTAPSGEDRTEDVTVFEPTGESESRIGARVLLVEDTTDLVRLMSRLLEGMGVTVDAAHNGAAALEAVDIAQREGRAYDIVLMDMQMPIMDGYEATRELRASGFDAPVIALTAHAMTGDRARCMAAGCDDYLTKPVHKAALHAALLRHCGATRPVLID